jgi:Co/Zn/Cd efflux system component
MLAIDTVFFVVELGIGLAVGSLALMADAFHMVRPHAIFLIRILGTDFSTAE